MTALQQNPASKKTEDQILCAKIAVPLVLEVMRARSEDPLLGPVAWDVRKLSPAELADKLRASRKQMRPDLHDIAIGKLLTQAADNLGRATGPFERAILAGANAWSSTSPTDIGYFSELCCQSAVTYVVGTPEGQVEDEFWQWDLAPRVGKMRDTVARRFVIAGTLRTLDEELRRDDFRMLQWPETIEEFVRETVARLWRAAPQASR